MKLHVVWGFGDRKELLCFCLVTNTSYLRGRYLEICFKTLQLRKKGGRRFNQSGRIL